MIALLAVGCVYFEGPRNQTWCPLAEIDLEPGVMDLSSSVTDVRIGEWPDGADWPTPQCHPDAGARDVGMHWVAESDGQVLVEVVDLDGGFIPLALEVRRPCPDEQVLACNSDSPVARATVDVSAGEEVLLVVHGRPRPFLVQITDVPTSGADTDPVEDTSGSSDTGRQLAPDTGGADTSSTADTASETGRLGPSADTASDTARTRP